jgi:putative ABC transport system permease protein
VFAIVVAEMLRPFVNNLAGTQLTDWAWANPRVWAWAFVTFFAGTLLAGLYPAFALSAFKPVTVLKAKAGSSSIRLWLRQGLVVLQFAASVGLLAGTVIVYAQLDHMRHIDLGIDLEQILTVPGPRVLSEGADHTQIIQRLTHELRQVPAIRQIATSSALPGRGFNWYSSNLRRETADPSTSVRGALARIDSSFASLYGLRLIAGRGFEGISPNIPQGETRPVILNETAVQAVGFDTPNDALQQLVHMGGTTFRVVGVFKDFNWSSAHSPREAALFTPTPAGGQLSLKVNTENLPQTIAAIERIYKTLFPGNPFSYNFVDEKFDEQYRNDQRFAALFSVFAGLAILIACLGLFGLASFSARQRTKEIGIRKVLGASVSGIVALLSKEFVKLILLANLIAWPIAYFTMNKWLQDFAYRIEIGWWVFALAGGMALLIALLTVSTQAIKAALANPVEALRYE